MKKSLIIPVLACALAVGCNKQPASTKGWSKEIKEEMVSYIGEVLPYAELDSETLDTVWTDAYLDVYQQYLYEIYDVNPNNKLGNYGDKLEKAGFEKQVGTGSYYYTKQNAAGFSLEVYFGYMQGSNVINCYYSYTPIVTAQFPGEVVALFYETLGQEDVNVIDYAMAGEQSYFETDITMAAAGYIIVDGYGTTSQEVSDYEALLAEEGSGWAYDETDEVYYYNGTKNSVSVNDYVSFDGSVRLIFSAPLPNPYDGEFDTFPTELVEQWFGEWEETPTIVEYVCEAEEAVFEAEDDYYDYFIYVNGSTKAEMLEYIAELQAEGWKLVSHDPEEGDSILTVLGTYSYVSIVNFESDGYIALDFYCDDQFVIEPDHIAVYNAQRTYEIGAEFVEPEVRMIFNDYGHTEVLDASTLTFSGYNMAEAGEQEVTVSYEGEYGTFTTSYTITVENPDVNTISYNMLDASTFEYVNINDYLDSESSELVTTFSDGDSVTIKVVLSNSSYETVYLSIEEDQEWDSFTTADGVTFVLSGLPNSNVTVTIWVAPASND